MSSLSAPTHHAKVGIKFTPPSLKIETPPHSPPGAHLEAVKRDLLAQLRADESTPTSETVRLGDLAHQDPSAFRRDSSSSTPSNAATDALTDDPFSGSSSRRRLSVQSFPSPGGSPHQPSLVKSGSGQKLRWDTLPEKDGSTTPVSRVSSTLSTQFQRQASTLSPLSALRRQNSSLSSSQFHNRYLSRVPEVVAWVC